LVKQRQSEIDAPRSKTAGNALAKHFQIDFGLDLQSYILAKVKLIE